MPFKCSVPGCQSNYKPPYVSCFRFPKNEERRNLWLRRIHRDNFKMTENARVCIKHFSETMIVREDTWTDKNGVIHKIPRKNPTLTCDAFPCIIIETIPHLNVEIPKKRKTWEEKDDDRIQTSLAQSILTYEAEIESSKLKNIHDVELYIKDCLKNSPEWTYVMYKESLTVLKLCLVDIPSVKMSFKVSSNLTYEIYCSENRINANLIGLNFHELKNKQDIDMLLKICDDYATFDKNIFTDKFSEGVKLLKEYSLELNEEKQLLFDILLEQMQLTHTPKERYRFSSTLLKFSFKIFLASPSTYKMIRKTKFLILPHPSNLRKMASKLNVCSSVFNVKTNYLRRRLSVLKPIEMYVNILLDEIYISPELSFKGGKLTGSSITNSSALARTAQVFSITSSFGSYKDVIAILPISENSGTFLFEVTKQILLGLHELNVKPLSIIADNNQVNKSLFSYFKPHPFTYQSVLNPVSSDLPLFLLYDTVHIFKNIRNNWLNQKNAVLNYPDLKDENDIKKADFNHLRNIYNKEKESLLKYGYKLSHKALFPSNVERQKVSLVCKIFNYENINALKEIGGNETEGTATFLSIILKWWNIVNVKSLNKDIRLKNEDFKAITHLNQEQLKYLQDISMWLNKWAVLSKGNLYNGLSNRTFDAFQKTCNGLYGLALFALNELKINFILFGKFQTDPLEERFSLYRQLSGSNYYISLEQLIESEKKIRIQNLLFHSNVKGTFHDIENKCNSQSTIDLFQELEIDLLNPVDKKIMPVALFIAGYAAFKTCKKIQCNSCINVIIFHDTIDYEFSEECKLIDALDRGSLKKPTAFTFKVTLICIKIFENVLEKFHTSFITNDNQMNLLVTLSEPYVRNVVNETDNNFPKPCFHDSFTYFKNITHVIYKILLNNYSKMETEKFNQEKADKRKIKKMS